MPEGDANPSPSSSRSLAGFIRLLGPGLLFAGTAIGVSHVFQSTRAGAEYGTALIWAVIVANLCKFPFFEFGPRYAMATGESLVTGYRRMGWGVFGLFIIVSLLTVFTVQAAVTSVTSALTIYLFGSALPNWIMSAIILTLCAIMVAVGRYKMLDTAIKTIILVLSAATLIALVAAFGAPAPELSTDLRKSFDWSDTAAIMLLIGLMGWMPAPIDLSVWHSLWALEKRDQQKEFNFKLALFDFRIGYIGTAILALVFLGLGALMLYGNLESFPATAAAFSTTLIDIYEKSLGSWAKWVIAIAAMTTMFSTTLTVLDGIPRVFAVSLQTARRSLDEPERHNRDGGYWFFLAILFAGTLLVIARFANNLKDLVDLATILSFLTAPFFAIANYLLVTNKRMPEAYRPGMGLRILSWMGILFLLGFGIWFITLL